MWYPVWAHLAGKKTVAGVIGEIEPTARAWWRERLPRTNSREVVWPERIYLVGVKKHPPQLFTFGAYSGMGNDPSPRLLAKWPVLATSGGPGPKLREGDRQVPEGVYRVSGLNPNSSYHLSIKLNYPNSWDRQRAKEDGRENPGSNIFIHGKNVSIGCLAMGDPAIEKLFYLVHRVERKNFRVFLIPDRELVPTKTVAGQEPAPEWLPRLYTKLRTEMTTVGLWPLPL